MKEGIFVTRVTKCEKCDGIGFVAHPRWAMVFEKEASGVDLDDAIEAEFGSLRSRDINATPEEIECGDCDGNGYKTEMMTLQEALSILGVTY